MGMGFSHPSPLIATEPDIGVHATANEQIITALQDQIALGDIDEHAFAGLPDRAGRLPRFPARRQTALKQPLYPALQRLQPFYTPE